MLSLKEQMLKYAMSNYLLEDAIKMYRDLTRLLGIDVTNDCFYKGILLSDNTKHNIADMDTVQLKYDKHPGYYINSSCNCTNGTCTLS